MLGIRQEGSSRTLSQFTTHVVSRRGIALVIGRIVCARDRREEKLPLLHFSHFAILLRFSPPTRAVSERTCSHPDTSFSPKFFLVNLSLGRNFFWICGMKDTWVLCAGEREGDDGVEKSLCSHRSSGVPPDRAVGRLAARD